MSNYLKLTLIICALFLSFNGYSQCDSTAIRCGTHLTTNFISDGQQYRSLLVGDEVAEFHASFFGGSTYRICACTGNSDGDLVFSLYDEQGNLLYTNNDYRNAPYWDFEFKGTVDLTIEAQLESMNQSSGCAVLLIGFKR